MSFPYGRPFPKKKVPRKEVASDCFATIDLFPPKKWACIKATHIDAEGVRYQICLENDRFVFCRAKLPSPEMTSCGCTHCSGPHRADNRLCNASVPGRPLVIPSGALMDMRTGALTSYRVGVAPIMWNHMGDRAGRVILFKTSK